MLALTLLVACSADPAPLPSVITTTDGATYARGADGHYYPSARVAAYVVPSPAPLAGAGCYAPPVSVGGCAGGNCPAPSRSSAPRWLAFPRK